MLIIRQHGFPRVVGLQVPGMRIVVQLVVRKENRIQKFRSAGSCSFSLGSNVLRMGGD